MSLGEMMEKAKKLSKELEADKKGAIATADAKKSAIAADAKQSGIAAAAAKGVEAAKNQSK